MNNEQYFKVLERFAKFVEKNQIISAAMYSYYADYLSKEIDLEYLKKESPEIEYLVQNMTSKFESYQNFINSTIDTVIENRKHSYCKYSNFAVSAAVINEQSQTFYGVNIENQSYGLTICAERSALFSAVSSGSKKISACIISADTIEPIKPCGACLQTLSEFMDDGIIISSTLDKKIRVSSIDEIFPNVFKFK